MMSQWLCLGLLVVAQLCTHTSQRPLEAVQEDGEETWTPEYPTESILADEDDQLTDENRDKSDEDNDGTEEPSNYRDEMNDEEVSEEDADDEGTDKPSDYPDELNDGETDEEEEEEEAGNQYADEEDEYDDLDKLHDEVIERNDAGRYTQNHHVVAEYNTRVALGKPPAPAPKSKTVTAGNWGTRIAMPKYTTIGKDEPTRLTGGAGVARSRISAKKPAAKTQAAD